MTDWTTYNNGVTIGQQGSEGGRIIMEEEHDRGARICLEQGGNAPFSITLGIYHVMFHTHFCSALDKSKKDYEWFKQRISEFLESEAGSSRESELLESIISYSGQ